MYVRSRVVCLQSDIANYWPGMHNTAFLVVFMDPCLYAKKHKGKTFLFLLHQCHVNLSLYKYKLSPLKINVINWLFLTCKALSRI